MTIPKPALFLLLLALQSCSSNEEVPQPVAGFTYTSDNNYLAPTRISFKNESAGASEYTWDFGDGSPVSDNINPIHLYEEGGDFTVTLIAAHGDRFDQVTEKISVFLLPTADFIVSSDKDFKEESKISFENKSLNAESVSWKFGDGETSTESNPLHSYLVAGTYTVELTAKNAKGADTTTKEITIFPIATQEQLQLNKLKGSWTLQTANDGQDRTADFFTDTNVPLVFHLSGSYVAGGTYNYSFTGQRPDPSPWPASGTWKFGMDESMVIIRDPNSPNEIQMGYQVTGTDLVLSFTVPDGSTGWEGGTTRIKNLIGDWTFTFKK